MNPIKSAVLAALGLVAPLSVPVPVHAAGPPTMVCLRSGHLTISPGVTMEARDFVFTERGRLEYCKAPDGSILSADLAAKGKGHGACSSVTVADVPFTVSWSNGQTSAGIAGATSLGNVAHTTGRLTDGLFAGARIESLPFLLPADPSGCLGSGLTETDYRGEMRVELPS